MINILLIALGFIMIWRIAVGAKRGLVRELFDLVNLIFISLILTLGFMIYRGYTAGGIVGLVPLIIAIVVLSILYAIIKLVFSPAKLVAKLPLVKSVDKILGLVMGAAEVVIVFWILSCVIKYTDIAPLENYVMPMITGNSLLSNLHTHNLLDKLLLSLVGKITETNVLDFIQV